MMLPLDPQQRPAGGPQATPRYALAEIDRFWMAYRPGTADEIVLFGESFGHDRYLAGFPGFRLSRTHVVMHIGAHIGGFAVMAAAGAGHVYAVEASRDSYGLLAANAQLNHLDNLTASHVALTDRRGVVTLYESPSGTWGNSLTPRGGQHGEAVPAMSLTDYCAEHAITRCDLLICNVEGAEFPIFLSATDVLGAFDRLGVMYHEDLMPGRRATELLQHFQAHGFRAYVAVVQSPQRGAIVAIRNGCSAGSDAARGAA